VLVGLIAVASSATPGRRSTGSAWLPEHSVWDPARGRSSAPRRSSSARCSRRSCARARRPALDRIALYLTSSRPRFLRGPITALVQTLAAIPSVVLGLWASSCSGRRDQGRALAARPPRFIPLFGKPSRADGIFVAVLILTIMIIPIIASITRELFLSVPSDLKDGALALG
jgi:phosphate transport system permease protein